MLRSFAVSFAVAVSLLDVLMLKVLAGEWRCC